MNKIMKKSMAGLLAGVMLLSGLAVSGITALAAPIVPTAINPGQAVSFTGSKQQITEGETTYTRYNEFAVYSFTPATTDYYALSVATTPFFSTEEDKTANYRSDKGYVELYEKFDSSVEPEKDGWLDVYEAFQNEVTYANSYQQASASYIIVDDTEKDTKNMSINGYKTVLLTGGKTYYLYARVHSNSDASYPTLTFSLAPTDFRCRMEYTTQSTKINENTTSYTGRFYAEVSYVGKGTNVVVPAHINGVNVEQVEGTANKSITSLVLGANVKNVYGFSNLSKLASLSLNEGLERIYEGAFYGDSALKGRLVIPASVKTIYSRAFWGTGYDSAQVLGMNTEIEDDAIGMTNVFNNDTVDPYDTKTDVIPDFFLLAPANSDAAEYAKDNYIPFYDMNDANAHLYVTAVTEATYFAKGKEITTCRIHGDVTTKAIAKKKVKLKSAKSAKKGQLTVKSAALSQQVTGYEIQYSTSKKFTKKTTKSKKVKTNSDKALSKTFKDLKSGKKYYVRVRVYSGKKNSAWSAKKAVKIK